MSPPGRADFRAPPSRPRLAAWLGAWAIAAVAPAGAPAAHAEPPLPLFDAHVHYNAASRTRFSPQAILAKLDAAGVTCALVSSTPNDNTLVLERRAPDRIVAFARPYRSYRDRRGWFADRERLAQLELWASGEAFRGVGEFHLFERQLNSEVIRALVGLAREPGARLQAHGDAGMIAALFQRSRDIVVIWAHAGADPQPRRLARLLERYPNLYVDLSVRNPLIAPSGRLDPAWARLLERHPTRFLAAIDTYSPDRWARYGALVDETRRWLRQLSPRTAAAIAHGNATRLLGCGHRPAGA